jgi:hypothetical protein
MKKSKNYGKYVDMSLIPTFIVTVKPGLSEEEGRQLVEDIKKINGVKSVTPFNKAANGRYPSSLAVTYGGGGLFVGGKLYVQKNVRMVTPAF